MSVERFLLIADPFRGQRNLSTRSLWTVLGLIWLLGLTLAIFPVIVWRKSTRFYGTYSGTCFPLLIQEAYPLGWQYSAFVFLGINLILMLMIVVFYTALLVSICRTRRATPLCMLDCEFAVRFFFIVLTDILCWTPIIIVKVWVFFNYNISGIHYYSFWSFLIIYPIFWFFFFLEDICSWLVVFIIPLNSAINPLLYTFTTPKYRNQILMRGWYKLILTNRRNPSMGPGTTIATGSLNPGNLISEFKFSNQIFILSLSLSF